MTGSLFSIRQLENETIDAPPLDEGLNDDFYIHDEDAVEETDEYNEGWYAGYKQAKDDAEGRNINN